MSNKQIKKLRQELRQEFMVAARRPDGVVVNTTLAEMKVQGWELVGKSW